MLVAGVGAGGVDGDHVDALDVFGVIAKVRGMVHFVLEEDAGVFVPDEVGRLVDIVRFEQEVVPKRALLHRQHQVPAGFHGGVAGDAAPHLHGVAEEGVFGGGFLVLAVGAGEEALGPRVAVVPVEAAGDGEERVRGCGVGCVADEGVDPGFVGGQPGRIEGGDDAGGVDEVGVVEVVVVVVCVAEVFQVVSRHVRGCGYDAAPLRFVDERVDLGVVCEAFVGFFELR